MDPEKVNYHYTDDLPTQPLEGEVHVLVTGANGYVGRRLVPELLHRGYHVRCMLRNERGGRQLVHPNLEFVTADGQSVEDLKRAMQGVEVAYYLIHSLRMGREEFREAETTVARNFVTAANECRIQKIVYLGGLGETQKDLSPHLKSRLEVGTILSEANCPVIRLRAAIIVGTGSASYELIKALVLHHRWVPFLKEFNSKCQPIAIRDVIKYLVGALETPGLQTGKYPIGGPDVMTYKELVSRFARVLGRRVRFFNVSWVPLPLTFLCRVFAYWLHLFNPVPVNITYLLLESLKIDVVCLNNRIEKIIPFQPIGFETAVQWALDKEKNRQVYSHWSDVAPEAMADLLPLYEYESSQFVIEEHNRDLPANPEQVFKLVCQIGGDHGWLHANLLWEIRGWIDRILGGVGLHRGRRDPLDLRVGDSVDFWRVEKLERPQELLLRAEMISPGFSWLQFTLEPLPGNQTRLTLRAHFIPYRFWGHLYWNALARFHTYIFQGLLEYFYKQAQQLKSQEGETCPEVSIRN